MASKFSKAEKIAAYDRQLVKHAERQKRSRDRKIESGLREVKVWVPKTEEYTKVIGVYVTPEQLAMITAKTAGQVLYLDKSGPDLILKAKMALKATEVQ